MFGHLIMKEKSLLPGVLMFLGVIVATLSVIVAGYIHGNMHIEAVYHSITNFT